MEKSNNRVLNELLVNLFHNVMDAEAKAVITEEFKDITNNDIHILEAIGIEEPRACPGSPGNCMSPWEP